MIGNVSPLRYPGGKTKIYPLVQDILKKNNLIGGVYVEPFAGGCGLALKLLFSKDVKEIIINDLDLCIYAFWFSVLNHTNSIVELILKTPITIDEWYKQKKVYLNEKEDLLKLGFATFFLNRTNVSGIIKGGVIGGITQSGKYKIDTRFNKEQLITKIKNIGAKKKNIRLFNLDAIDLLKEIDIAKRRKIFINFDPPYVKKGKELYKNSFQKEDHLRLCHAISSCKKKWIVTYDVHQLVREAYQNYRQGFLDIRYSAHKHRVGQELIVYSSNLIV
ncbi:DNA adenine methylase [Helicobacter anatolicus]|uniref:DNA adenine methylase n=1 Tax=Helicobacter anatolicus TaxID=2905874 RepID=UPI001E5AEDE5|nr:DNA adenine methylase [Helicobacter anatolicus]